MHDNELVRLRNVACDELLITCDSENFEGGGVHIV